MPRFVPTGDLTDKRPYIAPSSIRLSVIDSNPTDRFTQVFIIGISAISQGAIGYKPWVIGVSKIGDAI